MASSWLNGTGGRGIELRAIRDSPALRHRPPQYRTTVFPQPCRPRPQRSMPTATVLCNRLDCALSHAGVCEEVGLIARRLIRPRRRYRGILNSFGIPAWGLRMYPIRSSSSIIPSASDSRAALCRLDASIRAEHVSEGCPDADSFIPPSLPTRKDRVSFQANSLHSRRISSASAASTRCLYGLGVAPVRTTPAGEPSPTPGVEWTAGMSGLR